jgi:hypothetical protein
VGRRQVGERRVLEAVVDGVDDRLAVGGVVDRLLDPLVLELRQVVVEVDELDEVARLEERRPRPPAPPPPRTVRLDALVVDDVDLAGLELGEEDGHLRHQLDDDPLQRRRPAW